MTSQYKTAHLNPHMVARLTPDQRGGGGDARRLEQVALLL